MTAPKRHLGETQRMRSPAETFEAYRRFMPTMGITRIANITGLDSLGLINYTAIRPNSRGLTTAQGKGLDDDTARVSALMESVESWHAERIQLPVRYESYAELSAVAEVADISKLTLATGHRATRDTPLMWVQGEDLFRHTPVYVPYDLITMNTVHPAEHTPTYWISTDGLASGNHPLEATVHALCERIERDAVALWFATTEAPRPVDLSTVADPRCRQLMDMLRAAECEAVAWDMTSDVGVPTYGCYVLERPGRETAGGLGFYHGFASHLDATAALYKAIIEAIQGRVTFISGTRDDLFYEHYEQLRDPALLAGMWEEIAAGAATATRWTGEPSLSTDTFEGDLRLLLAALERAGFDRAIAVDLSRPEIGIPVVKVIVPGLEVMPDPEAEPGARVRALQQQQQQAAADDEERQP